MVETVCEDIQTIRTLRENVPLLGGKAYFVEMFDSFLEKHI